MTCHRPQPDMPTRQPRRSSLLLRVAIGVIAVCGLTLAGCASVPKRVARDSATYTAEIMSALARQEEAAAALHAAAPLVPEEHCASTIEPALLIDSSAQRQAYRALWLAGLPYPLEDGTLPDPKTAQEDPGGGEIVSDAEAYCNDVIRGTP